MLTKILSKIGLPLLMKFVSSSLGSMNNEMAKKAAFALNDVDVAINKEEISLEELKEANRHLEKSQELESSVDTATLSLIHETIRSELKSEDKFVRFWRPAFGYSVAFSWLLCMLTICWLIISNNPQTPAIIMALVETTSLWGIALGVLGISVVRSKDENKLSAPRGIFNKFINNNKQ
ncbi:MAG: ribokinase [Alphaproteobacteria bacterium]|nr:ribokinase [Alphaproteobacteria bacterium]